MQGTMVNQFGLRSRKGGWVGWGAGGFANLTHVWRLMLAGLALLLVSHWQEHQSPSMRKHQANSRKGGNTTHCSA